MPKTNLTLTTDITVQARELDFVTRFNDTWEALRQVLGIMRPIRKTPGTKLTSYKATLTLQNGNVAEGEEIPLSKATVEPVAYADLTLEKYAKGVTIEDVEKYGAVVAVQKTDEAFLHELRGSVLTRAYNFIQTGTLTSTESDFQIAVAMAIGKVKDKFKKLRKDGSRTVVWVNTLDACCHADELQYLRDKGMLKDSDQFDFLDALAVMSFIIGIMNLQENVTQGDIQSVMEELAGKADLLLTEIHGHLQAQDEKIDRILEVLHA